MCNARLALALLATCAADSFSNYGEIDQACTMLESELPGCVYYPNSTAFEQSVASYIYAGSRLRPNCILGPKQAEDVQKAVQVLTQYPSVEFAVRSGGHNINKGFANTDLGVTIDLAALDDVEVSSDKSYVSIGVGARWGKVYATVEQQGLSGISYYSPERGWACDSVKSFDIVLANGSLINANAQSNADLFRALKGGSNNFGIVTHFELDVFEQGPLTGGSMDYGNVTGEQVVNTITSFKQPQMFDKHAMLIAIFSYQAHKHIFSHSATFFHTRPEKYFGSTLEAFTRVEPQTNVTLPVMNNTAGFFADLSGSYDPSYAPNNFMHWTCLQFRVTKTILHKINGLYREHSLRLANVPAYRSANLTVFLVLQSVPATRPGNSLGFDPDSHPEKDQLNLLIMYQYDEGRMEVALQREINRLTKEVEDIAREERALSQFIYLNYAGSDQKVLEGYGKKSVEKLKRVAAEYDPDGVFQKQVRGGFKLSDVHF
ncbi:hypothetical protein DPSP01_005958 [Paraphaeosphaeria sporulosa]